CHQLCPTITHFVLNTNCFSSIYLFTFSISSQILSFHFKPYSDNLTLILSLATWIITLTLFNLNIFLLSSFANHLSTLINLIPFSSSIFSFNSSIFPSHISTSIPGTTIPTQFSFLFTSTTPPPIASPNTSLPISSIFSATSLSFITIFILFPTTFILSTAYTID
ncbi:hypothetical protein B9Z19DRAFT_87656, partial [Tuber borchii]